MIQEIYDYLLIRHILLTNSKEEILEDVNNKEMFDKTISVIANLMQTEDIILVIPELQEKVEDMVQKYRFDYCDKNNFEDINYIIGRLKDYNNMSEAAKARLGIDFFLEEYKDRDLSLKYTFHKENIVDMITDDFIVYSSFINIPQCTNNNEPFEIKTEIDYFVSTINLLLSRFPDFYKETNISPYLINILEQIKKSRNVKLYSKRYVSRTIDYLNNIEKEKQKEKRLEK